MLHASFCAMSDDTPDTLPPSKSQLKREAQAQTRLGEQLVSLEEKQLRQLGLADDILEAVLTARRIKQHGARKRQLLYLGKLLRRIDTTPLQEQLSAATGQSSEEARALHLLEHWRDRLLADDQALTELLNEYPAVDHQHIRQLIRTARREQTQQKPPAAARRLFRYLRSVLAEQ